jgi:hypothetical protein
MKLKISTGIVKEPHFILIAGVPGIGKTTFAAEAPKSIIVGPENGSNRINTSRAEDIKTHQDVTNAIKFLREEKHNFKSVGIDSIDSIEPLIWNTVCQQYKVKTIEDVGYGKGYTAALDYWQIMIDSLKDLRKNRDMNVICIAHTHVKTVNDPAQLLPYDRYVIKLNEKAAGKWREAVDALLFANYEDTVFKVKEKDSKAKASGAGVRKLYTTRRAAWDAKNRLGLPEELPLSYAAFSEAADLGQPDSAEQVKLDLQDLVGLMKEKDMTIATRMETAIAAAGNQLDKLVNIRNHARVVAGV